MNVGSVPIGVAVNPEGTRVYVANFASGNVYVIDTATNKVTATVDVGDYPLALGQFIGKKPAPELLLPVADSISNVTSGYVPLSVQFTVFLKMQHQGAGISIMTESLTQAV